MEGEGERVGEGGCDSEGEGQEYEASALEPVKEKTKVSLLTKCGPLSIVWVWQS